tara:strand:- start:121974 stop:122336 length:363 start_codon:yes stop_codon:yes gene_type:complete
MSMNAKNWLMSMMFIITTLISSIVIAEQAIESEQVIRQLFLTHHDFEDWTFTPKVNDKVLISNQSNISHSIYVTYPDGSIINLGVQLPGKTVTWIIPSTGDYILQCWIHPIIRADMAVSP